MTTDEQLHEDAAEALAEQTVMPMLGTITLDVTADGARVKLTKHQVETLRKAHVIIATVNAHATDATAGYAEMIEGTAHGEGPLYLLIAAYDPKPK